jgi:quinone-modifying oxidoreductase, subunit QmoB
MENAAICILGDNACARKIASMMLAAGKHVVLAADHPSVNPKMPLDGNERPELLETVYGVRLAGCSGGSGKFDLTFEGGGRLLRRTASVVVVAESEECKPNLALYGLKPCASAVTISDLPTARPGLKHVVFLNGLAAESHLRMAGEVMRAALRLQAEHGVQTYILTRNLKVATDGLEALSREARSAGVLFFKFTATEPEIRQSADGSVRITIIDELSGIRHSLAPDLVVVDENITPSATTVELGRLLEIESDDSGFIQGDNIHRLTVSTNRKGIIAAGAARCAGWELEVEASNVVLEALAVGSSTEVAPSAEIQPGRCVRCLTCFRVCPYRAISLNARPQITAAACESCGICAAECPREAIRIPGLERNELFARVTASRPANLADRPYIVAFCCRRSAGVAARMAFYERRGWEATINIVEVPCAGSLPLELMLGAIGFGADGVAVLTCHADNCHSRQGNRFARTRTEQVAAFLTSCGAVEQRLMFKTLAANAAKEFADIMTEFSRTLRGIRPEERKAPRHTGPSERHRTAKGRHENIT